MNTSLDCMPCFMKMVLRDARMACPGDEDMHQKIVMAWGRKLGELDLTQPPPELAAHLAALVRSMTGCGDLFEEDKKQTNTKVLAMLPGLRDAVIKQRDISDEAALGLALELSIIGNFIDRGVDLDFDFEKEIANVSDSISSDFFARFVEQLTPQANILILGDNTGEIVLDMLLVEELNRRGCRVTYAVRSKPVLNDATMEDAKAVGMTQLCTVVESGVDTPGTVIGRCLPEFLELMRQADVILSKGQGNFEALEGVWPDIFCALKVKCARIADRIGLPVGKSAFCQTSSVMPPASPRER